MDDFERGHLSYISPPEPEIAGLDWLENEIYPGEFVFTITENNGNVVLVKEKDIQEYIEWQFGDAKEI